MYIWFCFLKGILYVSFIFDLILMICSFHEKIRRPKNGDKDSKNHLAIADWIFSVGAYILGINIIMFVMSVLVYKTVEFEDGFIGIGIMSTFNVISWGFLWPYLRWHITMDENQIVFQYLFKRKDVIYIKELDLEKSTCIFLKGGHNTDSEGKLILVTKDGKVYKKTISAILVWGNQYEFMKKILELGVKAEISYGKYK